jgi:hypothetical protein
VVFDDEMVDFILAVAQGLVELEDVAKWLANRS